ncbi:MAG: sulfur transferase domain-containing protein [Gemmatimonadaceae bacterium]|nr:sulfur transferase domain-containing protein [Gemmatimonadaceae bacterium]
MTDFLAVVPTLMNGASPLPNVVTGGQPTAAELAALATAGVKTVLDLRLPNEPRGFDEPSAVEAAGMQYVPVPVQGMVPDESFAAARRVLQQAGTAPVLFHCASANRVGALLLPHLMLDHGLDQAAALAVAQRVGLRDGMLAQLALTYVAGQRAAG